MTSRSEAQRLRRERERQERRSQAARNREAQRARTNVAVIPVDSAVSGTTTSTDKRPNQGLTPDARASLFTVEWTDDGLIAGEIPLGPEMGGSWGALDQRATAERCQQERVYCDSEAPRPRRKPKADTTDWHAWDTDAVCNAARWQEGERLISRRACRSQEHPDHECHPFFEGAAWNDPKRGPAAFPNRVGA